MIVLGLVGVLSAAIAVYNRSVERQIVVAREHATVLGLLIRARSAGVTIPKGDPGELICGFGVHIEPDTRTVTYFKDLGTAPADCTTANHRYDAPAESIEKRILSSEIVLESELGDIVFMPPFGTVLIDDLAAKNSAIVSITSSAAGVAKKIKVNSFGQITEL